MLRPIGKNILVQIKPPEKKEGLIIPPAHDEPFEAIVIDKGQKADVDVEINDVVLLLPYCGSRISRKDEKHILISEKDILGVVINQ